MKGLNGDWSMDQASWVKVRRLARSVGVEYAWSYLSYREGLVRVGKPSPEKAGNGCGRSHWHAPEPVVAHVGERHHDSHMGAVSGRLGIDAKYAGLHHGTCPQVFGLADARSDKHICRHHDIPVMHRAHFLQSGQPQGQCSLPVWLGSETRTATAVAVTLHRERHLRWL